MTWGTLIRGNFVHPITTLMLLACISVQGWGASTPWDKIVPNTALKFPDVPKWLNYATKDRFPNLRFYQPIQVVFQSSYEDGLFVVEKVGRIKFVTDQSEPSEATNFLDITDRVYNSSESGLLSLAFHPNFEINGRFFVYYCATEKRGEAWQYFNRLSEFNVDPNNIRQGLKQSEKILINQPDRHVDHNGGGMLFGPDGYLYLTIGDEGQFYDLFENGQKLTENFFAGMLRIDVDKREGNLPPSPHPAASDAYAIPADNPFVGIESYGGSTLDTEKLRTEFYAIGMRNAWRFAFDPLTGKLYSGDTGDHTREEINEIIAGGNYGWPHREGSLKGPPNHTISPGDHSFLDPLAEYGREDGNDIAGMTVYRGTKFPDLDGCILFSDYFGGWIGRVKLTDAGTSPIEWFSLDHHIADIAIDPADDNILLADMVEGRIKQFVPPEENDFDDIPNLLSETGALRDTASFTIDPSFVPYQINVPFWSDYAIKSRWISFADKKTAISFRENDTWGFPPGTVFMKHFDLELRRGDPSTKRRLETRFLVITSLGGFYGLTYRWNETQDDAVLVPPTGWKETIQIEENGKLRDQEWHYPGRHDCMACHNGGPAFKAKGRHGRFALGFNTPQLNREVTHGQETYNQLDALNQAEILIPPFASSAELLPKLVTADNEEASLNYRVRSYLAANCEACHEGLTSKSRLHWNATLRVSNAETKLIDVRPYNDMNVTGARLVHRSDPSKSILLQRIAQNGIERMPPLGSTELDHNAIELIQRWILEDLSKPHTYPEWAAQYFDDLNHPDAALTEDPDEDGFSNLYESLTRTNPLDDEDNLSLSFTVTGETVSMEIPGVPNRYIEVEWTETPGDPDSWNTLDISENAFFFPASEAEQSVDLESMDQEKAFFRIKVNEL
ncbi:MAG: PQQ-dependent sugar dehydrogenase [Verrucomicrobia bacterium]|nr:PQQ-dependent sugar dehydrogenase [Verrucomicrobiota bacterium]